VFEIATLIIFVAWWVDWITWTPVVGTGEAIRFTGAIEPYFWPLLILAIGDLARNGVDLVYPYRTWPRVLDGTIVVLAAITAAMIATDIVRLVRR
jgi:hypothetical protein